MNGVQHFPAPQPNFTSIVYSFLKPGVYRVFLSASGSAGTVFESSRTNARQVSVAAGVFTDINAGTGIDLRRVQ